MRIPSRVMVGLAVALLAFGPVPVSAAENMATDAESVAITPSGLPVLQLRHWKDSPVGERQAFLLGFVSMVQAEYAWQGKKVLPVDRSTAQIWMRALNGVTIAEMDAKLNEYIAKNPDNLERSVLGTLGRIYAQPALSEKERAASGKRFEAMQKEFALQ